jgi:apolipoprotein D and lipocalin family protein
VSLSVRAFRRGKLVRQISKVGDRCMNVFLTGTSISLALIATSAAVAAGDLTPPVPVTHVDLGRYVGLWYEIARMPNRFQQQCVRGVTARYELRRDGRITVVNRCVDRQGRESRAVGVARVVDPRTNARLKVSFVSFLGFRPFWGDYWILGLGDHYEYAVVGTPKRNYGWILARTPSLDPENLDRAWQVLKEQGYDIEKFQLSLPDSGADRPSR